MKKRKLCGILFSLMIMCMLSGCTNEIPELSDSEMKMVEEYAAQKLLQYHRGYNTSILSEEERAVQLAKLQQRAELELLVQEEKERQKQEEASQPESSGGGNSEGAEGEVKEPEVYVTDIDQFLGLNGVEINYTGYEVSSVYPTSSEANDWQGMTMATGNNKLVVFEYSVENVSGTDQTIDLASKNVRYAFKINDSLNKTAITTILLNDLSSYRDTLPAGERITAVLIVEVSEDVANNIDSAVMVMKYNGEKQQLTLK